MKPNYSESMYEVPMREFLEKLDIPPEEQVVEVIVTNNERIHQVVIKTARGTLAPEVKRKAGGYQ